jgi:regulator of replication initiation timing
MGAKNQQQPPSPTTTSAMEAQLATLNATLGQICSKLDTMERAIHELRVENSAVREELAAARITITQKDETIRQLTENVNRIDQASRVNTLRIFGLPITNSTPTASIPNIVFKEIIAPVLTHAIEAGDLPATPPLLPHLVIDTAFSLPAKNNSACPVLVKLASSHIRQLIFRHKKSALPTIQDLTTKKTRSKFAIFEDLTSANHAQFRALSSDPRVKSIWSFNGQIRLKSHSSDTILKVRSLSDTFDTLSQTPSPSPPTSAMIH